MSSPLRVLTIGHSYVVGLNQAVAAEIARDPGIALTLAAPSFYYGDLRRIHLERTHHPAYEIVPLKAHLTRWNHVFSYERRKLAKLILEGEFDIVHNWEEPYTYAGYQIASLTARTRSRHFFWTAQNIVKHYPWPFSQFERAVFRNSQRWAACGELVRQAMVQKGFPESTCRIIPLAVDTGHFRPLPANEKENVLAELSLRRPAIGFMGRLVEEKGLDVLMAALSRLERDWSLLVLGSGPYESRLRRWASQRGQADRVRIVLAEHDKVARYLAAVDLLVAPSQTRPNWKEQFGRMVAEAFACRVAVIASDSGEIPYVVGDAGVILPESDSSAWADAIDELLADNVRRDQLAQQGYARAITHYSVTQVASRYLELYAELAGAAGGAGA